MHVTRSLQLIVVLAASALIAPAASAGSRCTDDPERCVERGASVSRPSARVVAGEPGPTLRVGTSLTPVVLAPARKLAVAKKVAPKPAKVTPRASAPATPAPTPGMGMLLKLSNGGGDVTWQQGKSVDNSGASWIL